MEVDPYVGFAGDIGETGLSYNVGYWYSYYPRAQSDFDYREIYAIFTYAIGNLSVSPNLWFSDDYFGDDFLGDANSFAYDATVAYELPLGFAVSARAGEQTFASGNSDLNYVYYDVGVAKDWREFTLGLRWHDTDGVDPGLADPELADGELVVSLQRSF